MRQNLTPQEKDRRATLRAEGLLPPEDERSEAPRSTQTWLWILVGVIVLLSLAAGGLAGFIGGRLYERARIGIATVIPDTYWLLGADLVERDGGVYFTALYPGGPVDTAGLNENDRLHAIGSETISTVAQAKATLARYVPGEVVKLTVERSNRYSQYPVVLGVILPVLISTVEPAPPPPPIIPPYGAARLGVYYRMIEPGDPSGLNEGAQIIAVWPGGAAEQIGLQPGDIILAVDNMPLSRYNTLEMALLPYSAGERVWLHIHLTSGETTDMQVTLAGE